MTALDFGPVVLGGNVFGWTVDKEEGFRVLDAFVDGGGRAIDTADVYVAWIPGNAGGESETIIGEWLASRGRRDDVVIATKVASLATRKGLSAANIEAAVEDSLRRLQTDRIDLYFAHRDDEGVPQEETLAAFDRLVRAGKVREIGASNFAPARLRSAAAIAQAEGLTPFTVAQDQWSLVERGMEVDLVPTLEELDVAEIPYSSLASGFLTGKYRPGTTTESARAGKAGGYLENPRNVDLLDVLDDVAADHGVSVTAVALAWLAAQRTVAAPIASARTPEQLGDLLEAGRVRLTPEDVAQLSAATEPVSG
ncbi:aldo/keto reductase [Amnibacterium setariae]|uniref:Aldo/keto reductase n=1 Tax=Amnibacterium setariae TaxID=2306585 RepID=A0A3A1U4M6_9MICO|nr:aldo/keto reductase [Amnibacterium setariae]RIX27924.1 aldo/keto reductase [Amnibacterium setariae]